jgi:ZIP family zinc transporter
VTAAAAIGMSCAGLATGIGGLGVLLVRDPSGRLLDAMLGFTAGVMLAATAFSLLVPALGQGSLGEVLIGFTLGGAFIALVDRILPHAHARYHEKGRASAEELEAQRRGIMLVAALTIHNLPEGMAVGTAFAAGGPELGLPLAIAIGVQNIPEGFAAAAPLVAAGMARGRAALVGLATGLVEPVAAFAAYGALDLAGGLLPVALAFAAAAMLYVTVDELIPEAQARGDERTATLALLGGFALMMVLDTALA